MILQRPAVYCIAWAVSVSCSEDDSVALSPVVPQTKLDRNLEGGMAVSIGRLREDTQYDYKFVCLSHNTLRGAAGGAVLLAELLCAEGYIAAK